MYIKQPRLTMFGFQMVRTWTKQLWTIRIPNSFSIRVPTVFLFSNWFSWWLFPGLLPRLCAKYSWDSSLCWNWSDSLWGKLKENTDWIFAVNPTLDSNTGLFWYSNVRLRILLFWRGATIWGSIILSYNLPLNYLLNFSNFRLKVYIYAHTCKIQISPVPNRTYLNILTWWSVVYFDQQTHACACVRMVENDQNHIIINIDWLFFLYK